MKQEILGKPAEHVFPRENSHSVRTWTDSKFTFRGFVYRSWAMPRPISGPLEECHAVWLRCSAGEPVGTHAFLLIPPSKGGFFLYLTRQRSQINRNSATSGAVVCEERGEGAGKQIAFSREKSLRVPGPYRVGSSF